MKKLVAICLTILSMCAFVACDGKTDTGAEKVQVTFVQEDGTKIVKTVEKGQALTDIPAPKSKTGYSSAWENTDFSYVTEDVIVNVVYTANEYTISYNVGRTDALVERTTQKATYDAPVTLLTPICEDRNQRFLGWDIQSTEKQERLTEFESYNMAENITLVALWEKEFSEGEF